jgi:LmbE family N-acetylglucosaminyl deacetylase
MSHTWTLCAVFAHPDDESFGMAGTLAKYAARGIRTALICATQGEAGNTNGLADSPAALSKLRRGELSCAAQALGLSELVVLDFPDGGGEAWDFERLAVEIVQAIERLRPQVVVTFDEAGVTRHPDHIAVHRAVHEVIQRQGDRLGVRRLFHQVVTCPEQANMEGPELVCVDPAEVDLAVDIRVYENTKRVALLCHRSQAADTAQILDLPQGSLSTESYQLAWTGRDVELLDGADDLFAGLGG